MVSGVFSTTVVVSTFFFIASQKEDDHTAVDWCTVIS